MSLKKWPLLFFVVCLPLLSGCDITKALSAQYAKEYCSCRFVLGQNDKYCAQAVEQVIGVSDYKVNLEEKSVWARGLARESTAIYQTKTSGCLLVD